MSECFVKKKVSTTNLSDSNNVLGTTRNVQQLHSSGFTYSAHLFEVLWHVEETDDDGGLCFLSSFFLFFHFAVVNLEIKKGGGCGRPSPSLHLTSSTYERESWFPKGSSAERTCADYGQYLSNLVGHYGAKWLFPGRLVPSISD